MCDTPICFQLSHQHQSLPACDSLSALCGWRRLLRKLGVLGQRPDRYNGASFGNLSCRHPVHPERFLITADETGHLGQIGEDELCEVLKADFSQQSLQSRGVRLPSDQALAHQLLYQQLPTAGAICHFHMPQLWQQGDAQAWLSWPEDALDALPIQNQELGQPLLVRLADHEDGFIGIATDLDQLGARITQELAHFWGHHQEG